MVLFSQRTVNLLLTVGIVHSSLHTELYLWGFRAVSIVLEYDAMFCYCPEYETSCTYIEKKLGWWTDFW